MGGLLIKRNRQKGKGVLVFLGPGADEGAWGCFGCRGNGGHQRSRKGMAGGCQVPVPTKWMNWRGLKAQGLGLTWVEKKARARITGGGGRLAGRAVTKGSQVEKETYSPIEELC